ncbi:MAG: hypothetical protein EB163_02980 [Nitrososphaeria archaeon]|nr:hypothetical protein [Nitrososphaeria archaeon]NDB62577.1 hypothetical protein [Nitrosopumilaceae archaeon]
MESTIFSAQNDITITTTSWPTTNFVEKHGKDAVTKMDTIYIYFLGSSTKLDEVTEDGVFGPTFVMRKGADGRFHGGPYVIQYQESGEKCVVLSINQLPVVPHYCDKNNQPLVEISTADSILQFKNNKIILTLTWIVIGFTIVTIRDPLRDIFRRFGNKHDNKRNGEQTDSHKK